MLGSHFYSYEKKSKLKFIQDQNSKQNKKNLKEILHELPIGIQFFNNGIIQDAWHNKTMVDMKENLEKD